MHAYSTPKPQVLVVDDDPDVVEQLNDVLTAAGYGCHCCRGSEQALEMAHTCRFDLIISDINLAGHSGLALCNQIRGEEGSGDVPMMFLSGSQTPDIIRRANASGGTYYLRKPFDPQVLLELLDKALWVPQLAAAAR